MSSTNHYLKTIYKELKYRATWFPGSPMKLGDVGRIEDGVFVQESTLEDLGITNAKTASGDPFNEFNFTSKSGVTISSKNKGGAKIPGSYLDVEEAGFVISFGSNKSVVFKTGAPTEHKITNIAELKDQIKELYQRGKWERAWIVITSVIEVTAATIILSGSNEGQLDITAKGKATVAEKDLVNVDAGLEIKKSTDIAVNIVAQAGATPLYRAHGFKKTWFLGKERFTTRDVEGISEEQKKKLTEGEAFDEIGEED